MIRVRQRVAHKKQGEKNPDQDHTKSPQHTLQLAALGLQAAPLAVNRRWGAYQRDMLLLHSRVMLGKMRRHVRHGNGASNAKLLRAKRAINIHRRRALLSTVWSRDSRRVRPTNHGPAFAGGGGGGGGGHAAIGAHPSKIGRLKRVQLNCKRVKP